MDDQNEIRLLVEKINESWLKHRPEEIPALLEDCFAEDIVMRGPRFRALGSGKQNLIQSYVSFASKAVVGGCEFSEPEIDVMGDTAVAIVGWRMTYEYGGRESREAGHDLFVLRRDNGRWLTVWRTIVVS